MDAEPVAIEACRGRMRTAIFCLSGGATAAHAIAEALEAYDEGALGVLRAAFPAPAKAAAPAKRPPAKAKTNGLAAPPTKAKGMSRHAGAA